MLDAVEKMLLKSRLTEAIYAAGDLCLKQFGFRAERPRLDVIMEVVNAIHRAETQREMP